MGINRRNFREDLNKEYVCFICRHVFEDPVQVSTCDHVFCRNCILPWIRQQASCPVDRRILTECDVRDAPRIFRSLLGDLDVICDFESLGCEFSVKLQFMPQMVQHVKECQYTPIAASAESDGAFDMVTMVRELKELTSSHGQEVDKMKQALRAFPEILERVQEAITMSISEKMESKYAETQKMSDDLKAENTRLKSDLLSQQRLVSQMSGELESLKADQKHKFIINRLKAMGFIVSSQVYDAMAFVDFKSFFDDNVLREDNNEVFFRSIACDVATRLERLSIHLKSGDKILYISNRFLYIPTCLALMVGPTGSVITMASNQDTIDSFNENYEFLTESGRMKIILETSLEQRKLGCPRLAPFDVIMGPFVQGLEDLKDQLVPQGLMYWVLVDPFTKLMQKQPNGGLKIIPH